MENFRFNFLEGEFELISDSDRTLATNDRENISSQGSWYNSSDRTVYGRYTSEDAAKIIQRNWRRSRRNWLNKDDNRDNKYRFYKPSDEKLSDGRNRYKFFKGNVRYTLWYDRKTGKIVAGKVPDTLYGVKNFKEEVQIRRYMNRGYDNWRGNLLSHCNIGWYTLNGKKFRMNLYKYYKNNKLVKGKHVVYYDLNKNRLGICYIPRDNDFTYYFRDGTVNTDPQFVKKKRFFLTTLEDNLGNLEEVNRKLKIYNPEGMKIGDLEYTVEDLRRNKDKYVDLDDFRKRGYEWRETNSYYNPEWNGDISVITNGRRRRVMSLGEFREL